MNGADKEMTVLGIDTSSAFASAALVKNGTLAASFTLNAGHTHSETILPMIKNVLCASSVTVDEISLVACTTGPGSFTGVRIGCQAQKDCASRAGSRVSGYLRLKRHRIPRRGRTEYAFRSRMRDGATSMRRRSTCAGEKPVRLFEDTIIPIGELCALLGQYGQTVYFVGDAAEALSRAAHECGLHSPALSPCMRISQTASAHALPRSTHGSARRIKKNSRRNIFRPCISATDGYQIRAGKNKVAPSWRFALPPMDGDAML